MKRLTVDGGGDSAVILALRSWGRIFSGIRVSKNRRSLAVLEQVRNRKSSDSAAAWLRWHDPATTPRLPSSQLDYLKVFELARVEALASLELSGMAQNLSPMYVSDSLNRLAERLYVLAREAFADPERIPKSVRNRFPEWVESNGAIRWRFSQLLRFRVGAQSLDQRILVTCLERAARHLRDQRQFAESLGPVLAELTSVHMAPNYQPSVRGTASQEENQLSLISFDGTVSKGGARDESAIDRKYIQYRIFDTQWDEIGPANRWLHHVDPGSLRPAGSVGRGKAVRLSSRLQSRILSTRPKTWYFDQEEGRIDGRRLYRLAFNKPNPRIFRNEIRRQSRDACVVFLVDQSGSMRGIKQQLCCQVVDVAVNMLETCGIRSEVLGFTTAYMKENPVWQKWHSVGRPDFPGRLNATRHIVYKSFNQHWAHVRNQMSLMLAKGFGQENFDGEALDWAGQRLKERSEKKKSILVFSDGVPYDEATVCANGRGVLEEHLRSVLAHLKESDISVVAIGSQNNLLRFYPKVLNLNRAEDVADAVFEALSDELL